MATLKAGYQLFITPRNGGSYAVSVAQKTETNNGITSILLGGEELRSNFGDTIGPFGVDREYTVSKSGDVDVCSVDQHGIEYYEAGFLPSLSSMSYDRKVVLTGSFSADTTEILLSVGIVKGAKSWVGEVFSANDAPADPASLGIPDGVTWVKLS